MTRREQQKLRDLKGAQRYFEDVLSELRQGWKDLSPLQQDVRIKWAETVKTFQRDVDARLEKMGAEGDDVAHA